jgi:hypothetical protein
MEPLDPDFSTYLPLVDDDGNIIESREVYCLRVAKILPNFPNEVASQWLYEHWSDIGRFDWLNFPSLQFFDETWSTDQILTSGVDHHPFVELYRKHFETRVVVRRSERIAEYMSEHGTWPVGPLLVENRLGLLSYPGGGSFCSPFHPLEGQHRLAVFMAFAQNPQLKAEHKVWRVVVANGAKPLTTIRSSAQT